MKIVVVPDTLRYAINEQLDEALRDAPPDALADRDALYHQLLDFYDEHGYIPDFTVQKR